jgi:hypothetical protein
MNKKINKKNKKMNKFNTQIKVMNYLKYQQRLFVFITHKKKTFKKS